MNAIEGTIEGLDEETLNELNPSMLPPVFSEERAGDIHTSVADISRLLSTLPLTELVTLQEGLS